MSHGNKKPPPPVAHFIILKVDTTNIAAPEDPPNNVDEWCSFEGQSNGVTNENFEISVKNTDTITWSGVSTTNTADTVKITEIDYESGTNLFGTADLLPAAGASAITGTAVNGSNADVETYKIKFSVYNNGVLKSSDNSSVYQIDPKIRMKT
jgi:hypothetical protein